MLTLVVIIYILCIIAFYAQMMIHGAHHFREDMTPSSSEVFELSSLEVPRKAA